MQTSRLPLAATLRRRYAERGKRDAHSLDAFRPQLIYSIVKSTELQIK